MTPRGHLLPDLLAFAAGIAWGWWNGWDARVLVWGLWLSSLMVGFTSLLVGIAATGRSTRALLRDGLPDTSPRAASALSRWATPIALSCTLFLLVFFCIHFGGFHWGHSVFLNMYFPVDGSDPLTRSPMPRPDEYLQVLHECWGFVPLALVAERRNLLTPAPVQGKAPQDQRMSAPYRNVIRLHLLIFFFSFAFLAGIDGPWIYLVVYAVYFFPWQRLQERKKTA